ncbi:MAG: hypothetical protein DMG11_02375 [Acidobacteria bacterium]|nr:MAG: hypothetical protein DMG11_02375 [Acidobacteriota bacterium]
MQNHIRSSIYAILLIGLLFAGCSSNAPAPVESKSTPADQKTAEAQPAPPAAPAEPAPVRTAPASRNAQTCDIKAAGSGTGYTTSGTGYSNSSFRADPSTGSGACAAASAAGSRPGDTASDDSVGHPDSGANDRFGGLEQ